METEKKFKLDESDEFFYPNPHPSKITREEYMAVYFRTYRYEYFLEKGTTQEKEMARTFFLQLIAYWEMRVEKTQNCEQAWKNRLQERKKGMLKFM